LENPYKGFFAPSHGVLLYSYKLVYIP
jgi:hypothetical protein